MTDDVLKVLRILRAAGATAGAGDMFDALLVSNHMPSTGPRPDYRPVPTNVDVVPPPESLAPSSTSGQPPSGPRYPVGPADRGAARERPGVAVRLPPGARPFRTAVVVRALRPFRRPVASSTEFDADEEATADAWCQTRAPVVVVRPRPVKSWSACLTLDASASMAVWTDVTAALVRAVAGAGAFRGVRVIYIDADADRPRMATRAGRRATREVPAASSPCGPDDVLLVVSDFCSRAWWSGEAFRLLANWARRSPVGLVGLLPEAFWPRTAIGQHRQVRLMRPDGDGPLYVMSPPLEAGAVLPAASLDERSFPTLPALLGRSQRASTGAGLWVTASNGPGNRRPPEEVSAVERTRQFLGTATPQAVSLAGFAALFDHISPSTLRLIRAATGMEATAVQDAEVLLGGLLRGERTGTADPPSWVYRFHVGVREELRAARLLGGPETEAFFGRFRAYLARRRNESLGIAAAIPLIGGTARIGALDDHFLDLDDSMLAALGPEFAEMAEVFREVRARRRPSPQRLDSRKGRTAIDAFISYTRRDLAFVERICDWLEERGVRCWIAPRDIHAGEPYAAAIEAAIESARAVVVFCSSVSITSEAVRREISLAAARQWTSPRMVDTQLRV